MSPWREKASSETWARASLQMTWPARPWVPGRTLGSTIAGPEPADVHGAPAGPSGVARARRRQRRRDLRDLRDRTVDDASTYLLAAARLGDRARAGQLPVVAVDDGREVEEADPDERAQADDDGQRPRSRTRSGRSPRRAAGRYTQTAVHSSHSWSATSGGCRCSLRTWTLYRTTATMSSTNAAIDDGIEQVLEVGRVERILGRRDQGLEQLLDGVHGRQDSRGPGRRRQPDTDEGRYTRPTAKARAQPGLTEASAEGGPRRACPALGRRSRRDHRPRS